MSKLRTLSEHFGQIITNDPLLSEEPFERHFQKERGQDLCVGIYPIEGGHQFRLSYFIGVEYALYVEPKLNSEGGPKTDYLGMLFSALKHPDILSHTNELFTIRFDDPYIEIEQERDLLTPLLAVHFLRVLEAIVRKGLKKSYYRVKRNLVARVKGKVVVADTIKHNLLRNKPIHTICSFDEFGVDNVENRILKKALVFVQRYLPAFAQLKAEAFMNDLFNYVTPVFEAVSEDVSLSEVKHSPLNVFYREYVEGIRLARLILKRFGYNITNAQPQKIVMIPPFWVDMSKLYELYVLGLLKDRYRNDVKFQEQVKYGQIDFLLHIKEDWMVIDAKYKLLYNRPNYDIDDVRQLSAYSRDRGTLKKLDVPQSDWSKTVLDCLIIYPQAYSIQRDTNGKVAALPDLGSREEISQFERFFKLPVKIPTIPTSA